ncbi:MAG: putative ABC transporter permease [Anaerovoracaceae bacterium]
MNKFLILAFLFFIGCFLGWGLEVLYRRFSPANVSRRWINPGFLVGPYLPLYGFGLCALYLLANLENTSLISQVTAGSKILLFIVMALVMTLFEYIAGVIFIKGMKVKLWDYSNEKFNFQGIICLKFSIYWALLGAIYYFLIHPHILSALQWFSNNLAFSFVVGLFFGVFAVDVVYSLGIVTKVRAFAKENDILVRYEELRQQIRQRSEENKEKLHWFLRFASGEQLKEHLQRYLELQEAFRPDTINEIRDKIKKQL